MTRLSPEIWIIQWKSGIWGCSLNQFYTTPTCLTISLVASYLWVLMASIFLQGRRLVGRLRKRRPICTFLTLLLLRKLRRLTWVTGQWQVLPGVRHWTRSLLEMVAMGRYSSTNKQAVLKEHSNATTSNPESTRTQSLTTPTQFTTHIHCHCISKRKSTTRKSNFYKWELTPSYHTNPSYQSKDLTRVVVSRM